MTREQVKVDFNGLTHDHLMVNKRDTACRNAAMPTTINNFQANNTTDRSTPESDHSNNQENLNTDDHPSTTLSTIAILRRLAMYDSLVLVKRYRACINGYTLEFPTSNLSNQPNNNDSDEQQNIETTQKQPQPQHDQEHEQDCRKTKLVSMYLDGDDPIYLNQEMKNKDSCLCTPDQGEIVYVPMNGLMARLDNYDRHGVSIDSRVYAFAMGLKTAEIFLTTSSMKEIQETPAL